MQIQKIGGGLNTVAGKTGAAKTAESFSEAMKKELDEVNNMQIQSDKASEKFMLGDSDDLLNVMIRTEEAKLALEMTVQIRNKVVEAYQEIMRMQI